MSRALEYLLSQPLLCTPEAAEAAASVVLREGEPHALEAKKGSPVDGANGMTRRDGVAILPVRGPIFRHADMMTDVCGGTTTAALARDLKLALDDPFVTAVLLDVDSPGGEAAGIAEFASMVRAAGKTKPVCAYVGHLGASAAYWISAAASEVVAHETASLGSIGVVMGMKTQGDRPGTKSYQFVSTQSPNKRPDLETEAGRAQVQKRCDDLCSVFLKDVAAYRGTTPESVAGDFGGGGVLTGQAAVDAGMADALGDFESTLARLSRGERLPRKKAPPKAEPPKPVKAARTKGTTMNLASILPAFFKADPEAAAKAVADAAMSSADDTPIKVVAREVPPAVDLDAERARIKAELEQAQRATMSGFFAEQASDWFDRLVADGKALPRDKAKVTALYVDCALNDRLSGPLGFEAVKGSPETATRLSVLAATFAAATDNGKTAEHVHDTDGAVNQRLSGFKVLPEADGSAGKGKADAETVLSLLEATPTGRAILAERARAGK